MQLSFKKCNPDDLDTLVEISKTTFIDAFEHANHPEYFQNYIEAAFDTTTLIKQLNTPASHFYFVHANNMLAGYFKCNTCEAQSDLNLADTMELERIYVLKGFQGKKIGQYMLDKVVQLTTEKGYNTLWLGVWEHNLAAIRFYERYGFKKFGEHPYALDTDIQTDWLMKLDIPKI